ncbi:MAG: hypothetical protein LC647_13680, partial [Beggiatoa sp.]|nr:hypothetical protein [Beggiatoa sp.]
YGISFEYMPELHRHFGYPLVLEVTAGACAFAVPLRQAQGLGLKARAHYVSGNSLLLLAGLLEFSF